MKALSCIIAISCCFTLVAGGKVKFTNAKCQEIDKSFMTVEECRLRVVRRGVIGLSIRATFYHLPLTNLTVNLSLYKRENGYKPFLYNITLDYCQFLKRRTRNPLLKIMSEVFDRSSNFNHTCPFNHNLIVKDMILEYRDFRLLPLPSGQYLFHVRLSAFNDLKATLSAYNSVDE